MEFDDVINEHLELQRRNAQLEPTLPIERYRTDSTHPNEPLLNHAAASQTPEDSPPSQLAAQADRTPDTDASRFWDVAPVFDWGDSRPTA